MKYKPNLKKSTPTISFGIFWYLLVRPIKFNCISWHEWKKYGSNRYSWYLIVKLNRLNFLHQKMKYKHNCTIVAKALDGQRYPCPALVGCACSWRGCRAVAQKGSMTYAFTHMGDFLLLLYLLLLLRPLPPQIPVSRPKFQSRGPYLSL